MSKTIRSIGELNIETEQGSIAIKPEGGGNLNIMHSSGVARGPTVYAGSEPAIHLNTDWLHGASTGSHMVHLLINQTNASGLAKVFGHSTVEVPDNSISHVKGNAVYRSNVGDKVVWSYDFLIDRGTGNCSILNSTISKDYESSSLSLALGLTISGGEPHFQIINGSATFNCSACYTLTTTM